MQTYKNKGKRRGGAATVMPLQYYKPELPAPAAAAGSDLLKASLPNHVRPRIGGGKRRTIRKRKTQQGGFVPSVMSGFLAAAQKYIVPIALFAGYKLMTKKGKRHGKRHSRRHRR
jgi:hypothetical protein